MQDELISRQAAIDAVNDVIADYVPNLFGRYEALPLEMASAINRLPPVNPQYTDVEIQKMQDLEQAELEKAYEFGKTEELKTGHWIDREVYDADRWKCSECGRTEPYKENYCPNCGAKMD